MAEVPIRNRAGEVIAHALVDDEDYEWAMQWRWSLSHGYAVRTTTIGGRGGRQVTFRLSRELLGLAPGRVPEVDHINGNPLDNRRSNLRIATHAQNLQNQGARTGRYRGVSRDRNGRWRARATLNYKERSVGTFDTEEEAARAIAEWRRVHMPFSEEAA